MKKDLNENLNDANLNDPNFIFDDESFIDDILNDSDLIGAVGGNSPLVRAACKVKLD